MQGHCLSNAIISNQPNKLEPPAFGLGNVIQAMLSPPCFVLDDVNGF